MTSPLFEFSNTHGAPYLVVMPYLNMSNQKMSHDERFRFMDNRLTLGSDPTCHIRLDGLEPCHAEIYQSNDKWYFRDLTSTLQVRQQGLLVRWFPLEFDSQTFVVGPWLCCFFTGEVSEASSYDQTLKLVGETDPLTGLPTRAPFHRRINYEIEHCCKKNKQPISLLYLDLDHFHDLNEKYDHTGGDAILIEVSKRLRAHTRDREMVARLGGEEIVVLLPYTAEKQALEVSERLRRSIADVPMLFRDIPVYVTASFGCVTTHLPIEPAVLLAQADRAMFRAKNMGRNCVCLYDASVDGVITASMVSPIEIEEPIIETVPIQRNS